MSHFPLLVHYHILFLHWSFFLFCNSAFFRFFPQNFTIHLAGDVVGALSFSVGHGANTLKKVASVRMLHQPYEAQNIRSYPFTIMVSYHSLHCFYQICPSDKLLISIKYFASFLFTFFAGSAKQC